jgi:hypothetical protein
MGERSMEIVKKFSFEAAANAMYAAILKATEKNR